MCYLKIEEKYKAIINQSRRSTTLKTTTICKICLFFFKLLSEEIRWTYSVFITKHLFIYFLLKTLFIEKIFLVEDIFLQFGNNISETQLFLFGKKLLGYSTFFLLEFFLSLNASLGKYIDFLHMSQKYFNGLKIKIETKNTEFYNLRFFSRRIFSNWLKTK